jgi:hypothetical protein
MPSNKLTAILILIMLFQIIIIHSQEKNKPQVGKYSQIQVKIDSLQQQIKEIEDQIKKGEGRQPGNPNRKGPRKCGRRRGRLNTIWSQRYRYQLVNDAMESSQEFGELTLNGSAVVSFQSLFDNPGQSSNAVGSFDLFLRTRLSQQVRLFFDFEVIGGNGPVMGTAPLSNLNGDAGSTQSKDCLDRINLLEAWAEFEILPSKLKIHGGKIDLTNYFDNNRVANDENSQFLGDMFVNSASLAAPVNTPGLRLQLTPIQCLNLQAGVVSIDNSGDSLLVNLFKIGSFGYKFFANTNYEAILRIYGYEHYLNQSALGWGASYDGLIGNKVKYFLRYGINSKGLSSNFPVGSAWSGGGEYWCSLFGKALKIGAAVGQINQARDIDYVENNIEVYTRHKINQWSYVSLHYQSIWSAGFDKNIASLIGVRTNFNF